MEQTTLVGLRGGARALQIAERIARAGAPGVVVCPTEREASRFAEDLAFFAPANLHIARYPADDFAAYDLASPDPEDAARRVEALWHLHAATSTLVVASVRAMLRRTIPRAALGRHVELLIEGEETDRDELAQFLTNTGYHRVTLVEDVGTFAVRGGILDVYPPLHERPVRIEFFGDQVTSIRPFEINTQRSKGSLDELAIIPVREIVFAEPHTTAVKDKLADDSRELDAVDRAFYFSGVESLLPWFYPKAETLIDYVPPSGTVFRIGPEAMSRQLTILQEELAASFLEAERDVPPPEERYTDDLSAGTHNRVDLAQLESEHAVRIACQPTAGIRQLIQSAPSDTMLEPLAEKIRGWQSEKHKVTFVCHTPSQGERLLHLLERYNIHVVLDESEHAGRDLANKASALRTNHEEVTVVLGDLSAGFHLPDDALVVIPEEEVFGTRLRRRKARAAADSEAIRSLSDLKTGDFIVHRDYGVGRFKGIRRIEPTAPRREALDWLPGSGDGPPPPENEFVHVEYLGGDKLFVPVYRMNLIQKYRGEDAGIRLDKLGGTGWNTRKKRVTAAVKKMARQLLELYAKREVVRRPAYTVPEQLTQFEAAFAYDETPDQARAINDVFGDMSSDKPMDRLVCGDVGFGKTEVALRAAFRVAMDGRQVGVLVPTTVLAQQHYRTFSKRFADLPIEVGQLSRFVTGAQTKKTLERMKEGQADIVIGTHRLLSKDVKFADLGLLVIDEEHRFGVTHKERLKSLRTRVDVLTLTATPIPRTLNMSMSGLRDLSVIETPPEDRLPIRTFVTDFDGAVIREAILRELARGGQVYFLHNRVQSIAAQAAFVRKLVPEARLGIAHGQMQEKELAQIMIDFLDKKIDVLVCTAIVESGLDIPSANTLIVNRADHFGLAQLYQIRGRVGRSAQRAYAYLLVPGIDLITKGALDRLTTLQEFTELGSGFRIAERDMEIRGVGNLLGANQHGHINSVGFDLYLELLRDAIAELKGDEPEPKVEPEINLQRSALIPDQYIQDSKSRVGYYRRLASARTDESIDAIADELRDRFGIAPEPVDNLVKIIRIKWRLARLYITNLDFGNGNLVFTITSESPIEPATLVGLSRTNPKRMRVTPEGKFVVKIGVDGDPLEEARKALAMLES